MLLRRGLTHAALALSVSAAALSGCARDIGELDDPIDPTAVVTAQFDPTNPIPVLQLVPSPTLLAQDPATGLLADDPARPGKKIVEPEDCELPTSAQCLAFVDGWPTTTPITFFFSGPLDETTIKSGILLLEVTAQGPVPVDYEFRTGARDPVNPACETAFGYTAADVPPGIQVQLAPTTPLKPLTQYIVLVSSHEGGGLRAETGDLVQPSALFHLLNVEDDAGDPVSEDGTINSALLRSNVQGVVLRRLFPGRSAEELTAEELGMLAAGVQDTGKTLYGLYQFFDGVIDGAVAGGAVADRNHLVLTNTWITGRDATTVAFDPANSVVPFPNSQLLTTGDLADPTSLQVNLPLSPDTPPTQAALIGGLNTLNGFSTTAPLQINFTRDIDASTVDGNIVMYKVDGTMLDPQPHPISITTSSASEGALATAIIQPLAPLDDNAHYVVAVKKGLKDAMGFDLGRQSTFNLLTTPVPLIDMGTVLPAVVPALQCSFVGTEGRLGADAEVQGLATLIETPPEQGGLGHSKWTVPVGLLTAQPVAMPPEDILFAFSYNTQDITGLMETVRDQLLPAWDMATPGPRLVGPVVDLVGTASIAVAIGIVENLCLPLCLSGEFEPDIPVAQCLVNGAPNPAIAANPTCGFGISLVAGNLARARLYLMRSYRATVGSPYTAGTFTPQTIMSPAVENIQVWVIEGTGNAPAGGRPATVVQHGLGSLKEAGFFIANNLAMESDNVTVLIDLPFHGSRASDLATNVNGSEIPCVDTSSTGLPNVDPADVTCDPQTGMCAGGCDGVQDSSGTGFLSTNVFGARDNFRQSLIDHLTLFRTLEQESMAGGALEGVIDGTDVGYIGQSLGGITGGNLAAVAPSNLQRSVLNVAGGSLTTILLNTVPQISAGLFAALAQAGVCEFNVPNDPTSGCKDTPAFRQFLLTAQWALDPGDPLATSVNVHGNFGAENILIQMMIPDPVVNNMASVFLAGGYRFLPPENNPLADHFQTYDLSALPQASQGGGCHGFLFTPLASTGGSDFCGECLVDALCNTIGAQVQAVTFRDDGSIEPTRQNAVSIFACDPAVVCDQ